ncbi:PhoH-like phosphate starvation-inducible [Vibrio phage phi 3]|uniref:PhoH-like protein n=1 Tax=Vibrio phage phi 3 TaxID=1589298 RepID=A0A0B5H8W9_9CAUD|nr:PhoH-like phosphate starvation-inducible [Vibrio phage phi 3]AJF40853.1 PhoH-like protein [Vibrio phage phi 3]
MSAPKTTENHATYRVMLENQMPVVCIGSQGTGKTYGAVKEAVKRLENRKIRRIVVSRPNVPFAETLGFLPGTDQEKLEPWIRPVRDLFLQFMSFAQYEDLVRKKVIEFLPFEHIQGLTFDHSMIILDECQNASFEQLKIFLGRQGVYSKTVLCGDIRQTSEKFKNSGLYELVRMVRTMDVRCNIIELTLDDCVRSEECKHWLECFEAWEDYTAKRQK